MRIIKIFLLLVITSGLFSCDAKDIDVKMNIKKDEPQNVANNDNATESNINSNNEANHEDDVKEATEITEEDENEGDKNISKKEDITENKEELSRELNTQGYELYKNQEYELALESFRASFEADEDYLYAHYNYACTLGVLMKLSYPDWYYFKEEIHSHLRKVISIRPDYIEKIKTDSDLDLIRTDFEYFTLLGFNTESDSDIKYLLKELNWYINGPGVITPIGGAVFSDDGTFTFSFKDLKMFSEGSFPIDTDYYTGNYEVQDGVIKFHLNEKMLRRRTYGDFFEREEYEVIMEFEGRLDESGTLHIEIFDYPVHNWVDEFSA